MMVYTEYALLLLLYFLPSAVGTARGSASARGILWANVAVGWTGFGWAFVLAWSLVSHPAKGDAL